MQERKSVGVKESVLGLSVFTIALAMAVVVLASKQAKYGVCADVFFKDSDTPDLQVKASISANNQEAQQQLESLMTDLAGEGPEAGYSFVMQGFWSRITACD